MTNREWLMNLSDDELAKVIDANGCDHCAYYINGKRHCHVSETNVCINGIKEWLNAKHKNLMPEIKIGDVLFCRIGNSNEKFVVMSDTLANNLYGGTAHWRELEDIWQIKRINDKKEMLEVIWRAEE